jgi:hypothetical protein
MLLRTCECINMMTDNTIFAQRRAGLATRLAHAYGLPPHDPRSRQIGVLLQLAAVALQMQ